MLRGQLAIMMVGPAEKRTRERTSAWATMNPENVPAKPSLRNPPNEMGTNESVHFCKLIGVLNYIPGRRT